MDRTRPTPGKATAKAPANIAFIKYWGRKNHELFLPLTTTNSMNLSSCTATTTVEFADHFHDDTILIIDDLGSERRVDKDGSSKDRGLFRQLARIRTLAGISAGAKVISRINFPQDAGIASSAAGMAAFTAAASKAAGLDWLANDMEALSREVRLTGSVSAARSTHDGFTKHCYGETHEDAVTRQIAPHTHWDLVDIVAIVDKEQKKVSSSLGHELAQTSPFLEPRIAEMLPRIDRVERAILERDLGTLGPLIEQECISMHAVMMTSQPPALYWSPGTISLIKQIIGLRAEGLEVYFTIDAGPNIHAICEAKDADSVERSLCTNGFVTMTIRNHPCEGVRFLGHL